MADRSQPTLPSTIFLLPNPLSIRKLFMHLASTFFYQISLLLIASIFFACYSYVGYILTKQQTSQLRLYRISQGGMIMLTSAVLFFVAHWKTTTAFLLIWWTFGHDLLHYTISEFVPDSAKWEGKGNLKTKVFKIK